MELRLLKYQQHIDEDIQRYFALRVREELHQLRDSKTGQAYFHPRTGRSPRKRDMPKTSSNKEETVEEHRLCSDRSEQLILRRKLDRFQELFAALKPDSTGYISADRIDVEAIDVEVLRVIAPMLEEMENLSQRISFPEFVDSMETLMKALTPESKAILLGFGKRIPIPTTPSHAPVILPYKFSPAYEERLQQPLYDRLINFRKDADARIKGEKDRKFQAEMAECSFHPHLQDSPHAQTSHL